MNLHEEEVEELESIPNSGPGHMDEEHSLHSVPAGCIIKYVMVTGGKLGLVKFWNLQLWNKTKYLNVFHKLEIHLWLLQSPVQLQYKAQMVGEQMGRDAEELCSFWFLREAMSCTHICSPRRNSCESGLTLVVLRLFFSWSNHLYPGRKSLDICTLVVSAGRTAILPGESECLYRA